MCIQIIQPINPLCPVENVELLDVAIMTNLDSALTGDIVWIWFMAYGT